MHMENLKTKIEEKLRQDIDPYLGTDLISAGALATIDIDNDNTKELVVVGEWMPVKIFKFLQNKLVDITDSLGWALFKLKRYKEAKDYLQLAVKLLPSDPIVNDHYGDALWKSGKLIQARYYWNYVLKLEKTEDEQKKIIQNKLIKGL